MEFGEKFEHIKHMNSVHSVKFKFECQHCLKSFRYLSHYFEHRRSHLLTTATNRPVSLNLRAGLGLYLDVFVSFFVLNFQEDICTGPNNLNCCEYCGKRFAKSFKLSRHVASRHKPIVNDVLSSSEPMEVDTAREDGLTGSGGLSVGNFEKSLSRMKFQLNRSQKKFYEENKLNFRMKKIHINRENETE
jgi:hypothetical protein